MQWRGNFVLTRVAVAVAWAVRPGHLNSAAGVPNGPFRLNTVRPPVDADIANFS